MRSLAAIYGFSGAAIAQDIKIGLIMEARPAEQPWSAAIFDSAEKLKKEDKGVSFSQSFKAFDPTSAEPIARQLLADGHNVMVMHSFALNDVAHKLAGEFKSIPMSVSSFDPPVQPNLTIATASYLQIGYSNCWLLAKLSKSGKIGFVGAMPIPYATELQLGCELGAKAARSDAQVLAAYSNSFVDQQATREQGSGAWSTAVRTRCFRHRPPRTRWAAFSFASRRRSRARVGPATHADIPRTTPPRPRSSTGR